MAERRTAGGADDTLAEAAGTDPASIYSRHVYARLLNFTSDDTPWQRRLWDVGSLLSLEELYEAGYWLQQGVLSEAAVTWQAKRLSETLGPETATGDDALRRELGKALKRPLQAGGDGRRLLRELIDLIRPGYLARWAEQVEGKEPPARERVARVVAAHLLDSGYSEAHLQRWLHEDNGQRSAAQLVHEAAALADAPWKPYEVIVPIQQAPRIAAARTMRNWLDVTELRNLLDGVSTPPDDSIIGGFRYFVTARDPEAAVQVAAAQVQQVEARASFARTPEDMTLRHSNSVYVVGVRPSFALTQRRRQVSLPSLFMGGHVYAVGTGRLHVVDRNPSKIDDALEQAAAINSNAMAPALTAAWVALEALLTEPRVPKDLGRVIAAKRAAEIVACSWPRAEMTSLLRQVKRNSDLSRQIRTARNQRERLLALTGCIRAEGRLPLRPSWRHDADLAAVERMRVLLRAPQDGICEVSEYLETSFRRLYRARNIIVHGGSTAAVALPATLRVIAPLIAAVLDRLAYGILERGREPLIIASHAELAIALLDSDSAKELVDLSD